MVVGGTLLNLNLFVCFAFASIAVPTCLSARIPNIFLRLVLVHHNLMLMMLSVVCLGTAYYCLMSYYHLMIQPLVNHSQFSLSVLLTV